ncbi:hypothetical protein NW767_015256 [Fusarium falciforme]|nr:hypothetical protein NW767_015256 [Fusarium falciforme]
MYPDLDLAVLAARKGTMRRRKPVLGEFRARDAGVTSGIAPVFDWACVPSGTDRRDPMLSPMYGVDVGTYTGLDIFLVSYELNRLANEGWRLASRLAGRTIPGVD